jgi:hypothetical protein
MPAYDAELFDPPAPLARVGLRHSDTRALISEVPMLLDWGANQPGLGHSWARHSQSPSYPLRRTAINLE